MSCLLHSSTVYSLTASVVDQWQDVTYRSNTCESRRILLIMCFSVELQLWAATACCTPTHKHTSQWRLYQLHTNSITTQL